MDTVPTSKVSIPKPDNWPGTFEAFKIVKPYIRPQIWNFVTTLGIGIIGSLFISIVVTAVFKHTLGGTAVNDVISLFIGAFLQATILTMFFAYLNNKELDVSEALSYGYNRSFRMLGVVVIMEVLLVASFILLVIPFFFLFPRVYLAPYFLMYDDLTVGEAFAASWHLTKGHAKEVYGIVGVNILLVLLCLTIIGIPFAIYWGIINSSSLAFLTMYLSQPKMAKKALKTTKS
jgi:hypothetical protein